MSRPTLEQVEARMRPDRYSTLGFLGRDESLTAILQRDAAAIRELGLTADRIGSSLERVLAAALAQRDKLLETDDDDEDVWAELRRRDVGGPRIRREGELCDLRRQSLPDEATGWVVDQFQVFRTQYRGIQECPWDCEVDSSWSSFDFLLLNRRTLEQIRGPALITHLARRHGFFEGVDSPYRVDPEWAARVLELCDPE